MILITLDGLYNKNKIYFYEEIYYLKKIIILYRL